MNSEADVLLERKKAEIERRFKNEIAVDDGVQKIDGLTVVKNIRSHTVEIPVQSGIIYITFSEIQRSKQSFETVIQIQLNHTTEGVLPGFEQRIDLNSASAVSNLATALNSAFGNKKDGYNWILLLNRAGGVIKKIINDSRKPHKYTSESETYKASSYLLYPFLEEGVSNMVHGDSGTGKSYWCLLMAVNAILGRNFFGFETKPFRTLYLDWEDTLLSFENRLHRAINGVNSDFGSASFQQVRKHIDYYNPQGSLSEEEEIISSFVEENKYDLIIVDAGGDATGGSPLDEQAVLRMFSSLDRIPCTKLMIHHEPKNTQGIGADKSYYGTTYWKAKNRVVWRLTTENVDNEGVKTIKAEMTKANNTKLQPSFFFGLEWSDSPTHLIKAWRKEGFSVSEKSDSKEKSSEVLKVLSEGEMPITTLSSVTGIMRQNLHPILKTLVDGGHVSRRLEGKTYLYQKTLINKDF